MTTAVCFVRHGETEANVTDRLQGQTDVPLNANGLAQAELIAGRLKDEPFDVIYSSDLSRALVTAEKIASGRPVIQSTELREWFFGDWQGMTLQEITARYPEEFQLFKQGSLDFVPPGGESSLEFLNRAERFMQMLAEKHAGQKILCVSHGGFIKQTLKVVLKIKTFDRLPACENTAVSRFCTQDGSRWQLVRWNDASHLKTFNRSTGW
jgi:probable phosphoglycerate mutase